MIISKFLVDVFFHKSYSNIFSRNVNRYNLINHKIFSKLQSIHLKHSHFVFWACFLYFNRKFFFREFCAESFFISFQQKLCLLYCQRFISQKECQREIKLSGYPVFFTNIDENLKRKSV